MKVLILGGTREAKSISQSLHPNIRVINSLSGVIVNPSLPVGLVRIGGFNGTRGMYTWLIRENIKAVVDATHPFATIITKHAVKICNSAKLPYLLFVRPTWNRSKNTILVVSNQDAAKNLAIGKYNSVFLTTGKFSIKSFKHINSWFLVRSITEPNFNELPSSCATILSRGPYDYYGELNLIYENIIDVLVTKNSGSITTVSKLKAANTAGIKVIMINRSQNLSQINLVNSVNEVERWILSRY